MELNHVLISNALERRRLYFSVFEQHHLDTHSAWLIHGVIWAPEREANHGMLALFSNGSVISMKIWHNTYDLNRIYILV